MHLISRSQGYHGTHGLGTSLGGIAANREAVGPLDPHSSQVPHDSLEALEAEIERVGADRVAAVFVEPVIGAGGVHPPRPGYLEAVEALCKRTGVLLVIDAVIAGFGRLGEWFGPERWGMRPDMIVFAKGVTSGYLPLGGVVISGTIAAPFWDEPNPPWFRHGPTYAGHPTSCAVALANLDIIEREGLLARGLELEADIAAALRPLESHALVGEVRAGTGALGAVALSAEVLAREPKAPMRVWTECRDRGVLVRPLGDAVGMSPALIATRDDVEGAASVDRRGARRRRERARRDRRGLAPLAHDAHRRRRAAGDPQVGVAVGARAHAAGAQADAVVAAEVLDPLGELVERARAVAPGGVALVVAADRDRLDERAEQVGVGVVDVAAQERQRAPAAAEPARDAQAERAGDARAADDLQVHARADAAAGPHAPRQLDGADERLAQAALQLHARGELGDVERARLVLVELDDRRQRVGGAAGGDDVGARLGIGRRDRGHVAVAEAQRALALAQRDLDADRAAQLAGRAAEDRRGALGDRERGRRS